MPKKPERYERIAISIPRDALRRIDANAKAAGVSRSEYLATVGAGGTYYAVHRLTETLERAIAEIAGFQKSWKVP